MAVQEQTGSQTEGGSAMDQAREQVAQTTGEAREKTANALRTQVDERSTQAGEQIRSFGQALRRTGEQLREEGNSTPAGLAEQVASRAERAGTYLQQTDGSRLLTDLEEFGRRRPWVVAAGGLVAGLLASRLMKASSQTRYEQQSATQPVHGMTRRPELPQEVGTGGPGSPGYA